jgi:predicted carbohydrate-binding protein with CBM5 and CBM33 domain
MIVFKRLEDALHESAFLLNVAVFYCFKEHFLSPIYIFNRVNTIERGMNMKSAQRRSLLCFGAAAAGVGLALLGSVSAHGYTLTPPARQHLCVQAGGQWAPADGSGIPNPACRTAYMTTGDPLLYTQPHEYSANVLDYRNQAAVQAKVPDGLLCSGGNPRYRGMSIAADWQKTSLPAGGGRYQIVFNGVVAHNPSFWEVYLSKPGYNSGRSTLNWSDLELLGKFDNIPVSASKTYSMSVDLPSNRQAGESAVMFIRWQRDDLAGEGFYNCSDVVFGDPGTTLPPPPPPTQATIQQGNLYSFRTVTPGFDRYIRHYNSLGFTESVDAGSGDTLKKDATWKIAAGLADPACYSFEAVNQPGKYLRHAMSRLRIDADPGDGQSDLFRNDATFCLKPGLDGDSTVSLAAKNFPNRYIRHRNGELWLDPNDSATGYKQDASWAPVTSWSR